MFCAVKSGIVMTWLRSVSAAKPMPMPNNAVPIGSPMREDRPEGNDEDDDCGEDAVHLTLGELELGEDVPAVLDRQSVDLGLFITEVADVVTQVDGVLEVDVLDVELRIGDRLVFADLLWLVVRTGEIDTRLLVGEGKDLLHRLFHGRIVHALLGTEHDLRRQPAERGIRRLELVEDVARLAVGRSELRVVVGARRAGGHVDNHK